MEATPPAAALLTAEQAAEYLNISLWTLRQWCSQRRIPCIKLGRAVRFDPVSLAAYVAAHTQPAERDGEAGRS